MLKKTISAPSSKGELPSTIQLFIPGLDRISVAITVPYYKLNNVAGNFALCDPVAQEKGSPNRVTGKKPEHLLVVKTEEVIAALDKKNQETTKADSTASQLLNRISLLSNNMNTANYQFVSFEKLTFAIIQNHSSEA